ALLALDVGGAAVVELPRRAARTVVVEGMERHPDGSLTWRATVAGTPGRPVTITVGPNGVAGSLVDEREGSVVLASDDEGAWVVDRAAAGLEPAEPEVDDATGWFRVPRHAPAAPAAPAAAEALGMVLPKPAPGEIDVLVLVSTGLRNKLGAGLGARIANLFAIANRTYVDSSIQLRLNVLDTVEIALPDNTSNFDALYRMTDGDVPATAGLHDLRDRYGADLVVLLRPYDSATHQGCGAAWISGYGGAPVEWSSDFGFATVSDGSSNGKYCDDLSLVHEIGHNLGAMHDRANAGTAVGAYPFGFGYGVRGVFGTVMSYITPRIGRYSDPDVKTCVGLPCGISETRTDSAHDELAIELARGEGAEV
ncbi:MAG: reprolysin-like metallopeptidase, partial [Alphaproteobacteria bacterium]